MKTAVIILLALALVFSGFITWAMFGPLGKNTQVREKARIQATEKSR